MFSCCACVGSHTTVTKLVKVLTVFGPPPQFNLQAMAMLPALGLGYLFVNYGVALASYWGRPSSSAFNIRQDMCVAVRDIHRLLQLARNVKSITPTFSESMLPVSFSEAASSRKALSGESKRDEDAAVVFEGLSNPQLGELLVLVRRLCRLLESYRPQLSGALWGRVREDVFDLKCHTLTPDQRLAVLDRMYNTYGFLQPKSDRAGIL